MHHALSHVLKHYGKHPTHIAGLIMTITIVLSVPAMLQWVCTHIGTLAQFAFVGAIAACVAGFVSRKCTWFND